MRIDPHNLDYDACAACCADPAAMEDLCYRIVTQALIDEVIADRHWPVDVQRWSEVGLAGAGLIISGYDTGLLTFVALGADAAMTTWVRPMPEYRHSVKKWGRALVSGILVRFFLWRAKRAILRGAAASREPCAM